MLKRISIRMRLTLLSILLLLLCCLLLTTVLNFSAKRMVEAIEVVPAIPGAYENYIPSAPLTQVLPASTATQARKTFLDESVLWMLLIVSVGGTLTYYITGRALRPLNDLSTQMKNRTVHNLSETLPIPESHDELRSLTLSFNDMTCKLDEAFSMQKRFSQSAAHELRTPLTVMKTKLEVFHKKPNRSFEEYEALFHGLEAQTDRLSDLVRDLLDLTCMDSMDVNDDIRLDELLADIASELSTMAQEQKISLELHCPECSIKGSRSLMYRAFYNLVENALKYNTVGGNVSITAKQTDGETHVIISDTGIGIPSDQQALIFEPFYRVDKSRSRQMGGAGLGLATVKSIFEKHNAKIEVSSNPTGGSIFTVIIH